MKSLNGLVVILCGISAIIWTIKSITDIVNKTFDWLTLICAIVLIAAFFVNLKRYRSTKKDK